MAETGAVQGKPLAFLRVDGLVLFAAGIVGFFALDEPWWLLPVLLLAPDLFMVGYARSSKAGALLYNVAHSYALPAVVGVVGVATDSTVAQALALIWFAHIGMDRMLGFGLKYDTDFKNTHLGRIGGGGTG